MNPRHLAFAGLVFLSLLTRAQDAPTTNAAPEKGAREAAPAFVEAVTFKAESSGDQHTLTVISAPSLVRIEAPDDRLTVIYDPAKQHYIGLENSNYTYWEFTWPEVRDAVQGSTRYATRLRDIGPTLMEENAVAPPATNSVTLGDGSGTAASDSVGGDDTGYVWHTTPEKKRIAGFDCEHYIGETVAGETIDAWCAPGLQAPIQSALATLKEMNEPMALVPIRELVPPLAFVAWGAMTKGGVTPILITWGSDANANRFAFISAKQREGKVSYFQIPSAYRKTTLVTMDGINNQKPTNLNRPQVAPVRQVPHDTFLPGQ